MAMSLKDVREAKGVKQVAMASHLGVSRQTYASWERDPRLIRYHDAVSICAFLGCGLDEIFFGAEVRNTGIEGGGEDGEVPDVQGAG